MYIMLQRINLVWILFFIMLLIFQAHNSFGGPPLPCGDPQCDVEGNCLGTLCSDECKWCPGEPPGDRCILNTLECGGGPLDCGDPQCDVEDNCLGILCNDECKWCPDALPGDRCVADFVECTVAPNPGPATVIPTLNQWGLIFTSLFLGLIAAYVLIRKRNKA